MSNPRRLQADVAIVGFGPVGAVLAGLTGRRGLDVVVIEREAGVFPLPRAAHVDHTGLRTIQELGCLDALLPTLLPNPGLDFVTATGELLMRVPGDQSSLSDLPSSVYFHQPIFDRALRTVAEGLPNVRVELGVEAREFESDKSTAKVIARDADGGPVEVTAPWVIGCDGSWSPVREAVGISLEDLRFEERWLVVDLVLREAVAELPERAITVCDPARPLYSIPMPAPRHRFEFMLLANEDSELMQRPARVNALLAPWVPEGSVQIERSAVYTFHGLVADKWRAGRILIAGDAAHQMPPFLGQGMCSGLRDAANLAWKLDLVVRNGAPDWLLDTYGAERRPHVRHIIDAAIQFGRVICITDPVQAAERDRAFLADPRPPMERIPFALPALERGPLVGDGGGDLFPQWRRGHGAQRFDDVVGSRFLVIGRTHAHVHGSGTWWKERLGAFVTTVTELRDVQPALRRWMDFREVDVVVVRPDRYVLAAGRDLGPITESVRAAACWRDVHYPIANDREAGMSTEDLLTARGEAGYEVWEMRFAPVNALAPELLDALEARIAAVLKEPDVSVVVLTSGLRVFSAGADATWIGKIVTEHGALRLLEEFKTNMDRFRELCLRMRRSDVLFVAALGGHTLAGGLELAVACDLRFAADHDRIQIGASEMKLFGVLPSGGGGTQYLSRLTGPGRALDLLLEAEPISPRRAMEIGLVERLYPAEELLAQSEAFAARISARAGRIGINAAKRGVLDAAELPLYEALEFDRSVHWDAMRRGGFIPGIEAFVERFGSSR